MDPPATEPLAAWGSARNQIAVAPSSSPATSRPAAHATRPQSNVRVRRHGFVLWWLAVLVLHLVALGFWLVVAAAHMLLPSSSFFDYVELFSLSVPTSAYPALVGLYAFTALLHLLLLGEMLRYSLRYRTLAFRRASEREGGPSGPWASPLLQRLWALGLAIIGREGLLGVASVHFPMVFALRESIEIASQSYQAYRMSYYVPRAELQRLQVAVIVVNCWSTPLILVALAARRRRRRVHRDASPIYGRLLCIFVGCLLNVVVCIGIPIAIVLRYVLLIDPATGTFVDNFWYNEQNFLHAMDEFRQLLIGSWHDGASRFLLAWAVTSGLISVSRILPAVRPQSRSVRRHSSSSSFSSSTILPRPIVKRRHPSSLSSSTSSSSTPPPKQPRPLAAQSTRLRTVETLHLRRGLRVEKLVHAASGLWGLVVLALHLHATTKPLQRGCRLVITPWGTPQLGCSLLEFNCYRMGISGDAPSVLAVLDTVHAEGLGSMVFRHCPGLEIPGAIQRYPRLVALKIYNSTVRAWPREAALTAAAHPDLVVLAILRAQLETPWANGDGDDDDDGGGGSGRVPPGLLSPSFPPRLKSIQFCATPLHAASFPGAVARAWPLRGLVFVESANLSAIPPVLLELRPTALSLTGNRIREIPDALLAAQAFKILYLSGNPLRRLPATIGDRAGLEVVYADETAVESLPPWAAPSDSAFHRQWRLYLGGTPLCLNGTDEAALEGISCERFTELNAFPLEFETATNPP